MARGGKVMVAMSGGVDSSVAAFLLKDAGYDVVGATMCLGIAAAGDGRTRCCGPDAVEDARRVCETLGIPHYSFDFSGPLQERVIDPFVAEYARGRTPNPCVECNRSLKFGILLEKSRASGFEYLATGHYAAIEEERGRFFLRRALDRKKDQTYFLYGMPAASLPSILFPLARLSKEEVRRIAGKAKLPVAGKRESQDICFVTGKDYTEFVLERVRGNVREGSIVDRDGNVIGRHRGIIHYTVGQRSGMRISSKAPLYVVAIDAAGNRIVAGEKKDLLSRGLVAGNVNLFVENWPDRISGKIRYRKQETPCRARREGNRLRIAFEEPQEAVTPGQSVVLYEGDTVLGGGIIEEVTTYGDC
jgi:tRNA-specific 2-thiouridylase